MRKKIVLSLCKKITSGFAIIVGIGSVVCANFHVVAGGEVTNGVNPYQMIEDRNVFHLVPVPTPPPEAPANAPKPASVKLTGLMRVAGEPPRALFVSSGASPTNTAYFNLAEGDHDGGLTVVRILEDQEGAEIIDAGVRTTVWLKDSKPQSVVQADVSKLRRPPISPQALRMIESEKADLERDSDSIPPWVKAAMLADVQAGESAQVLRIPVAPQPITAAGSQTDTPSAQPSGELK